MKGIEIIFSRENPFFCIFIMDKLAGFVGWFFLQEKIRYEKTKIVAFYENLIFLALFLQTQNKNNKNNFESNSFKNFGEMLWN